MVFKKDILKGETGGETRRNLWLVSKRRIQSTCRFNHERVYFVDYLLYIIDDVDGRVLRQDLAR